MRPCQTSKQVLFCLVLWLSVGTLSTFAQQSPEPASSVPFANATVADFKSKTQVQLPGQNFSAPTVGQVLPAESEINTGDGQILLRLEDGSEVLVHPHSHVLLKQPTPSNWQRLQLLVGRIRAEVQKRISGAPPFQVGTPSAVISVRGTRFYVDVDKHKTTQVEVEEGAVQLENANGVGTPVLIPAGSSSRVGEDSAPEPTQPTSKLQKQSGKSVAAGNSNAGGHGDGGNAGSHGNGAMGQTHNTPPGLSKGVGHKLNSSRTLDVP